MSVGTCLIDPALVPQMQPWTASETPWFCSRKTLLTDTKKFEFHIIYGSYKLLLFIYVFSPRGA